MTSSNRHGDLDLPFSFVVVPHLYYPYYFSHDPNQKPAMLDSISIDYLASTSLFRVFPQYRAYGGAL